MIVGQPLRVVVLVVAVLASACSSAQAPAASPAAPGSSGQAQPAAAPPKRLTVTVQGNPTIFSTILRPQGVAGSPPGTQEMEELLMAGLTNTDNHGVLRPQLAEAVPSLANGRWTTSADGSMQTTWKIRAGA